MKKKLVLIILLFALLTGCASNDKAEEAVESGNSEIEVDEKEIEDSEEPKKSKEVEEVVVEEPKEAKELMLFEDDKVVISFLRLTSEGIEFMVENKTDIVVTIQADTLAINGLNVSDINISEDISPRSKGKALAKCYIENNDDSLETISGQLRVIDFEDNWDTYKATFVNVPLK